MAIFDMKNMPLDEFCKRLADHPEQDKEVNAEMIKKIFPECTDITVRDPEQSLKCYAIMDGDESFYAASSEEDALKMHVDNWGPLREETTVNLYPVEKSLETDDRTLTAGRWVEIMGPGMICSTAINTR